MAPEIWTSRARVGLIAGAIFAAILVLSTYARYETHLPVVYVRWAPDVGADERARLERRLRLSDPRPHDESDRTWAYRLRDWSTPNIRAIIEERAVEDTGRIVRERAELQDAPERLSAQVVRSIPVATLGSLLIVAFWIGPPWAYVAGCIVLVAATVAFQLSAYQSLSNDHAGYLAMARQVVLGEWPIRDFLDHGTFLHVLISAALQGMFGHHLLAEMLFCYAMLAFGYCVTFYLASSATRSVLLGFLLALGCVLMVPRPYSYPKVALYPVAIWLLWRYVRAPTARRSVAIGIWAALALMMRVDHGVALISASTMLVAARHVFRSWRQAARAVGLLLLWFGLALVPFGVYVAVTAGLGHHAATILEFGSRALAQADPFWFHVSSLGPSATAFQIGVALIHDAYVIVTGAATAILVWRLTTAIRLGRAPEASNLRLLAVLGVWAVSAPMLVRDNFTTRFPDVGPILVLLGSATMAALSEPGMRETRSAGARRSGVVRAGLALVLLLLLVAPVVLLYGGPLGVFAAAEAAWRDRVQAFRRFGEMPPTAVISGKTDVVQYVRDCTAPDDRLLVTWFAPELYFASNRRFLGNQWVYINYQNSVDQQRHIVGEMERASVPVVLARPGDTMFAGFWPLLAEHIERNYVLAATLDDALVYVDRDRTPVRTSRIANLPCFAGHD